MKKPQVITTAPRRLSLDAETALDLMTPHVQTLPAIMTVKEAAALLTTRGISAAPVLDALGRPVGVLSRSDILKYDYEKVEDTHEAGDQAKPGELVTTSGEPLPHGFHVEPVDPTLVRDIMTPVLFTVAPQTPADIVVVTMLALKVHRLFVGGGGDVIGVVSALDVLRHLRR
jgi:CBS domain-containing protein